MNLAKLNEGPEMHIKMVKAYSKLMSESNTIAGELLRQVANKDVGITEGELGRINNIVTALNKAAGQGAILKGIVGSKGAVNERLLSDVKYQYDNAHNLANALEKAGAEAVKRQPTITQEVKATTEAKKEERVAVEKSVEATKQEAKAQQEVTKAVRETVTEQKKLAEVTKNNSAQKTEPIGKPAQNIVVQVQQENNEIQAALAKREALLNRLNDTSRITSKRTYDRRMETLGGLNKTLNTAGYEELLPRYSRTTHGDDYYKEYVKDLSGYNAMQREMNNLIERGIAPTRERWQAEKNRYDNMIAILKAGKVISTKNFVDPTMGSYENFLAKIREHQKATSSVSGISLNLNQFNEQVNTVIAKLEQIKSKGNIPVHLDVAGLKEALKGIDISVDSTAFHKKIAELRKSIDKLEPFKLAINADASQFNSVVDNCLKKLKELRDTNVTIIAQTREVAKGSNDIPKKETKEKSKKEMDYDKVLAMLKANQNTDGMVQGNSTVGARLRNVKILQSAAMLEGGWQPKQEDLVWLANERNALEQKAQATNLNNTRPGTNLIDEQIRLREQESKRLSEQLQEQMKERAKQEAQAIREAEEYKARTTKLAVQERMAEEAQIAKEQREYSDRTAKLLAQEKFAQAKEEQKAERARLDANNKQLRENLKAWQRNNTAIEKAKEEAHKRRLAQEAKERMQEIQNNNTIAKAEKNISNRWQQYDMLDNVTPKAYLSMFQFLEKQIGKIESLGGKYTGRRLTQTPEEYKAHYMPPFSGLDESARKQQKIRDIAFAYSQELARQNQMIQSGVEIKQRDIDASERRVAKLKRDWEQTGATQELREAPLVGRDAKEVNRTRAIDNAMAWQNSYFSSASSKVSSLTSSLERLYTELNRNPGNTGIRQYINKTAAELVRARKEAKEVARQMEILQSTSFKGWGHKLRWVGGAFGFYESYDFLARFGETITKVDESIKNLETVMPSIHKNRQALEEEQTKLINVASRYGAVTEEIVESARLWGRMYKDQNTVNALTEQTAKLAIADNFSIEESTKAVEAAMFQFGMQAKSTAEAIAYSNNIIDVYTKLSHNAGVSAQDLAAGVERSGAVAHQAGMDFEFLTALVAQGTRATALSGLTNNSPFMLETA
ncbi:phage tail tape measure protein [Anaerovibrio sp.]|uniref:phage tail tape measure protein n=1 Tax=Anaerovibrio sp. TaxID=1872532 RepID=UPI003F157AB4